MTDITAIGEILIDLTQSGISSRGIPQFDANPGGAPANLAVAAARLGASAAFIGKVGADSFGVFLKETLSANRVDISGMVTDPHNATTLAVVSVAPSGERSFSFYRDPGADVMLQKEELCHSQLTGTRILHFGSVSLTCDPSRSATLHAVNTAKAHGAVISYDPNYRASLWPDEETALAWMKAPLELVDILKVSDEELPLLTGTTDLDSGSAQLAGKGIQLILVTLGEKGAYYRFGSSTGQLPGVPCRVADTNGAGDTFFGAFLAQLAKAGGLDSLSVPQLRSMIAHANKAASLTTSRPGAIPAMPCLEEVFGN